MDRAVLLHHRWIFRPDAARGRLFGSRRGHRLRHYLSIPGLTGVNLTTGGTYTLSFTLGPTTSNGAWTAAGFGDETTTAELPYNQPGNTDNSAPFWALYNTGGNLAILASIGSETHVQIGGINDLSGNVAVVLSITANSDGTDFLAATINGNSVALNQNDVTLAPTTQVFIGTADTAGSADNLDLSVTGVPEPESCALLLGGAAVLLIFLRARRPRQA
jgi:hypothetical protein